MKRYNILITSLLVISFLAFIHSRIYETITTKTIVIRDEPPHYYRRYGYRPPPSLCPYRAKFY